METRKQEKQREGSLEVSGLETPTLPGNVFEERLKSEESFKILVNCMRHLEKEVKEIHRLAFSAIDN